jgi:hypothetical protein
MPSRVPPTTGLTGPRARDRTGTEGRPLIGRSAPGQRHVRTSRRSHEPVSSGTGWRHRGESPSGPRFVQRGSATVTPVRWGVLCPRHNTVGALLLRAACWQSSSRRAAAATQPPPQPRRPCRHPCWPRHNLPTQTRRLVLVSGPSSVTSRSIQRVGRQASDRSIVTSRHVWQHKPSTWTPRRWAPAFHSVGPLRPRPVPSATLLRRSWPRTGRASTAPSRTRAPPTAA